MNQDVDERDEYELSDDEVGLSLLPPAYNDDTVNTSNNSSENQNTTNNTNRLSIDKNHLSVPQGKLIRINERNWVI